MTKQLFLFVYSNNWKPHRRPCCPSKWKFFIISLIATLAAGTTKRKSSLFYCNWGVKTIKRLPLLTFRRKPGEYLDMELTKVLKEREKKMDREKREREWDKERYGYRYKRYKCGAFYYGDFTPGRSVHEAYAYQFHKLLEVVALGTWVEVETPETGNDQNQN